MHETKPQPIKTDFPRLQRRSLKTPLMNLGYLGNLSCTHRHAELGSKRAETLDHDTIEVEPWACMSLTDAILRL